MADFKHIAVPEFERMEKTALVFQILVPLRVTFFVCGNQGNRQKRREAKCGS